MRGKSGKIDGNKLNLKYTSFHKRRWIKSVATMGKYCLFAGSRHVEMTD